MVNVLLYAVWYALCGSIRSFPPPPLPPPFPLPPPPSLPPPPLLRLLPPPPPPPPTAARQTSLPVDSRFAGAAVLALIMVNCGSILALL